MPDINCLGCARIIHFRADPLDAMPHNICAVCFAPEMKALMAKLAAQALELEEAKKALPSEAFKAGCQKNVSDAKLLNEKLFQANSRLSIRAEKAEDELSAWLWKESSLDTEFMNRMIKAEAELAQAREQLQDKMQWAKTMRQSYEDEVAALKDALRVFKRYGKHRWSCVQVTGKQCSCGFDDAATRAGALAAPRVESAKERACLDPDKMKGAEDGFGGEDYPSGEIK